MRIKLRVWDNQLSLISNDTDSAKNYNPFLEQSLRVQLITKSVIICLIIAFLLGLFFSLMMVLIRLKIHR
jgi:hypothetical protein